MKFLPLLFCLWGCLACGVKDVALPITANGQLSETLATYTALSSEGFLDEGCDALLFTALRAVAVPTDLRSAREENGRWHRTVAKNCYANWQANQAHKDDPNWQPLKPDSQSTISRDMLLGVMIYAAYSDDLELVERMWEYGARRSWIMGDGLRSRTQFTPALVATLAQTIHFLGGADHLERHLPRLTWPEVDGFEAHIQVLHILLRMRVYGTIDVQAHDRLVWQRARSPENALFVYANGDTETAISLLNAQFPRDHLPTSADQCARWRFERDPSEWAPCPDEGKRHSGGELLFLGTLITKG